MHTTRISFLQQLNTGDSPAWEQLQQIYRPLILNWLRRYQLQESDAEDLTQEVMLLLTKRIAEFEHSGNVGAFRNWLRTSTVNLARNYFRKKRNNHWQGVGSDSFMDMLNQLADPESQVSATFHLEHDRYVVRQLLQRVREHFEPVTLTIFDMHVVQGVGAKATAEQLNVPVASVHTAKSRVLRRLRAEAADLIDEIYLA